jgi:c-di-GMP-binding flagellar brake protein YcgR
MPTLHRRAFRHAVDLRCQIVRQRDFRLVAERAVDLSTDGMLVRADRAVLTGEPVLVSFRVPRSTRWIDAEATVVRVSHGRRPGEGERRLGLVFQGLDHEERHHLFQQLRVLPPSSKGRGGHEARARRAD